MHNERSNENDMASATILVKGKVQGVYFRKFTVESARKLGLTGFAQNLPDGNVSVFAEGKRSCILKLIALLHKGPPMSKVDDLHVVWSDHAYKYKDFDIKR